MRLLKHFFPITVIALFVLFAAVSYYRFVILSDYLISYEAVCNPEIESCYVGCDDEECTSEYYYSVIERHATEIHEICGGNVLECPAAQDCQNESGLCFVTYCDPEIDGEESCALINEDV